MRIGYHIYRRIIFFLIFILVVKFSNLNFDGQILKVEIVTIQIYPLNYDRYENILIKI